jgi:hypothetical protein
MVAMVRGTASATMAGMMATAIGATTMDTTADKITTAARVIKVDRVTRVVMDREIPAIRAASGMVGTCAGSDAFAENAPIGPLRSHEPA